MTHKWKYLGVLASFTLAQAASAQQISKPLSSLTSGPLTGKILCRDGTNVPMTADQEQSLPLRIVAHLNCGQEVSLLSGSDGYTINVHTADGKSGYVAWMNVAKGESVSARKTARQTAAIHDGVAKWVGGAPGSDKFYSQGLLVESLTANGVTVQVSLQDTGWKLLANVAVANDSLQSVNVVPSRIALSDLGQANKSLAYQNPKKMKTAVNHQILWTEANASPSASGYLVNAGYQVSDNAVQGNTQNYLAQHQATVQLVSERKAEFNPHSQMNTVLLNETVVLPNQQIAGASWFERDGKRQDMTLRVPVGGIVYEFPFSFHRDK